jgi:hypothetical protein
MKGIRGHMYMLAQKYQAYTQGGGGFFYLCNDLGMHVFFLDMEMHAGVPVALVNEQ